MKVDFALVGKVAMTLIVVAAALLVGRDMWHHFRFDPWTRDARVRTEIVEVAPDVSGLVTEVRVVDNQLVQVGDVLFEIDKSRFEQTVSQAKASVDSIRVQIAQATRENKRNGDLTDLVSNETREQSKQKLDQLAADMNRAQATLESAKIDLSRTEVRATARGLVTNLSLRVGAYAMAGRSVLALLDQDAVYVLGYFEETKIARIHVGDRVDVHLMGDDALIRGRVDSIAGGIEDRERTATSSLLANVNPTFNWVRLAQRVPVRIRIDDAPSDTRLIMGRTATVDVLPASRDAN